jgi:hypothetical protein
MFDFKTYARPVWSGSIAKPVQFRPLPRREAVRLYHRARAFERQTRQPGKQNGAIGRTGLAVLHAFLFDFLNFRSGRLDPGYKAIARAAAIGLRSVPRALRRLRDAGILNWVRRCVGSVDEAGRFFLAQQTNAYGLTLSSQWRGYSEPPDPEPGTWGDHPCGLRDSLAEACAEIGQGGSLTAVARVLELGDGAGGGLALLARGVARKALGSLGAPEGHRNPT